MIPIRTNRNYKFIACLKQAFIYRFHREELELLGYPLTKPPTTPFQKCVSDLFIPISVFSYAKNLNVISELCSLIPIPFIIIIVFVANHIFY